MENQPNILSGDLGVSHSNASLTPYRIEHEYLGQLQTLLLRKFPKHPPYFSEHELEGLEISEILIQGVAFSTTIRDRDVQYQDVTSGSKHVGRVTKIFSHKIIHPDREESEETYLVVSRFQLPEGLVRDWFAMFGTGFLCSNKTDPNPVLISSSQIICHVAVTQFPDPDFKHMWHVLPLDRMNIQVSFLSRLF